MAYYKKYTIQTSAFYYREGEQKKKEVGEYNVHGSKTLRNGLESALKQPDTAERKKPLQGPT